MSIQSQTDPQPEKTMVDYTTQAELDRSRIEFLEEQLALGKQALGYRLDKIQWLTTENQSLRAEAKEAFDLIHTDPSEARRTLFRALRLDLVSGRQND